MESNDSNGTLDTQIILQLKAQLLGEDQSEVYPQPKPSGRGHVGMNPTPLEASILKSQTPAALSANSPHSRDSHKTRRVTGDHAPPRLLASKSSPVGVVATTAESRAAAQRMYRSFGGYLDDFGDTQPIDSQTFVQHSDLNTSREGIHYNIEHDTADHTVGGKSYHEGDVGFIDLVGNIETNPAIAHDAIDLSGEEEEEAEAEHDDFSSLAGDKDDADELCPETHLNVDSKYSHTFTQPKTPATHGKKHNRNGDVLSSQARTSATRTPGSALAAIFGNNKGGFDMSMTQIFQATQAASSPLPEGPRSDPVFERPSPNIHFHQRNTSPMAMSLSSPIKQFTSDSAIQHRAPTDPLDSYLTVKQSQERRRLREEQERRLLDQQEEEDDDFLEDTTEAGQRHRFRLEQAKIRKSAITSCMDLKAPPRSSGGGPIKPSRLTRRKSATDISSEIFQDTSQIQRTPRKAGLPIPPSDALTDDDSMDELSPHKEIQVPRTSSLPNGYSQTLIRTRRASQQNSRKGISRSQSQRIRRNAADSPSATQKTVAVADSQGDGIPIQGNLHQSPKQQVHSSYVPNSQVGQTQYSALSSQKRVLQQKNAIGGDTSSPPRPPRGTDEVVGDEKMPSSPPVMPAGTEADSLGEAVDLIGEDVEQATDVGELQDEFARIIDALEDEQSADVDSKSRNESDPNSGATNPSAVADATERNTTETNKESEVFETAPSHISASPRNQNSGNSARPSPNISRIRKLTEIAADPTPENSFESVNLNFNIITEEEQQEQAKLERLFSGSSPVRPNKRRKVYSPAWKRALREPAQNVNAQLEEPAAQESGLDASREQSPTPSAPVSAKKRHERTAQTTSPNRSLISQPSKIPKPPPKRFARKTGPKTVARPPTASGRPKHRKLKVMEIAETTHAKAHLSDETQRDIPRRSASRNLTALDVNTSTPRDGLVPQRIAKATTGAECEVECVANRVLARFRGAKMAYYPATCIGMTNTDGIRYKIRFDDGTIDHLEGAQIRKLTLRKDDWVKVDLPEMRTKTYVVCGRTDKITLQTDSGDELANPEQALFPLTDVHGYKTVQLAVKARDSLSAPGSTDLEIVDVPITSIYVTSTMWSRFSDRKFAGGIGDPIPVQKRIATPSVVLSEPGTPTSRSRRQVAAATMLTSHVREPSTASVRRESSLFANMAFAVTFTNVAASEKSNSIKMITDHGGMLLDSGFDELFGVNMSEPQSPKRNKKASEEGGEAVEPLRLRPTAQKLGFTALIADRYCRRAKYMQALALDIPCLHSRWLSDSIAAAAILPFQSYLLPAGESAFLSGAVRSRVLAPYDPLSEAGKLENVLSRRKLLLGSKNVLLVMGKGRAEERRKAYLFLTYALGAANVGRVRDLSEARAFLDSGNWDWIYVDGDVDEAEKALLLPAKEVGKGGSGGKRKRSTRDGAKVVDDEFVIQSLILGALMEK